MRVKVYTPQRFISALILRDGNKCENELVMTLRAVNIKDTKLNKILEHYCQNGRVQGLRIVSIFILPKCIFPTKSAFLACFLCLKVSTTILLPAMTTLMNDGHLAT